MIDLSGLNGPQQRAVQNMSGACLVLAGPGSGKTKTITSRVGFLIQSGVPPEKILVITFTKEAAVSMEKRFHESEKAIYPVSFGTFHSVFYSILRKSNGYSSKKLLSDQYKKKIISKILSEQIPLKNSDKKHLQDSGDLSPEFISAFSVYKNTRDRKRAVSKLKKGFEKYFDDVFLLYEKYRKKNGLYDFDDMVYDCFCLLNENKEVRDYWQTRFDHILIDEYQDINRVQFDTVDRIKGNKTVLFAVGDDDQAIYSFRGSDPSLLRHFQSKYNAETVRLEINYRSTGSIIKTAEDIIKKNKNRFEKKQYSYLDGKAEGNAKERTEEISESEKIKPLYFENKDMEYAEIAKNLNELTAEGSCAVLFRTNMLMQGFATYLTDKKIPYHIKENDLCIYDHPAAADLLAYLEVSEDKFSDRLYRVINKPVRYINREALFSTDKYKEPLENAAEYYEQHSDEYNALKRSRAARTLQKQLGFMMNKPLYLRLLFIRRSIGMDEYYRNVFRNNKGLFDEYLSVMDFICEDSKKYDDLSAWKEFIHTYREDFKSKKTEENKNFIRKVDKHKPVQLMTVHGSKGLEFDTVIIPDVNEGIFPHGKMLDAETVEEERRIFYVAVTRAKRKLLIACVTGTKEQPVMKSRFLDI